MDSGWFLLTVLLWSIPTYSQHLDAAYSAFGDGVLLETPCAMGISSSGDRIAISDRQSRRVVVVDLSGKLLWGGWIENLNGSPSAVSFADDKQLVVALEGEPIIVRLEEGRPSIMDTVVDLTRSHGIGGRFSAIVRQAENSYLVLDESKGQILQFDRLWTYVGVLVPHGPGRGRVLVPSALACAATGRLVVTDRRNIPVQAFSSRGEPLYSLGWNQPQRERHWEASAATFDVRNMLWVTDDTNSLIRLYDPSGTLLSSSSYDDRMYRPIAMAATPDHRVAILDQGGWLFFYSIN